MDNNNWRPTQGGAEPAIDTGDWRTQLQNESRQMIVNMIMDTLKRYLPVSGQEGLQGLEKIAIRFEEKIYTDATSQSDYLRKISLKMLAMESKSQNIMTNSLPSNSANNNQNPPDAGFGMQSQIGNQVPLLPVAMGANQGQPHQQLLNQNIQNNIPTTPLQGSSCLTSSLPGGLPQTSMPSVGQNISLQNMQSISGVSQNSVANSMGQGVSANMYAPQILYQHLLQQQMRQKYSQGNIQNSHMQQQNLLQSSQQSVMLPNLQQNQQSSVQQSQLMLQQNPQSVLWQHTHLQPQSMLPQQQQILGQQPNSTSMYPTQLIGRQNIISDMQQQRQLGQQNNISNLQQQPQQQLMGQQQLGPQGNVPGLQQLQMLRTQSGNSIMENNNQHPALMIQQTKVPMPLQQNQQNSTALLPSQSQHSQSQMPQEQLMPQILSQPGQLQQQQNQLHRDMQQRLQSSGPLLPSQNMIDQKQMLFQSQRPMPEAPSSSLDSTAHTGNANSGDWQEIYQKILTMKEAYLPELNEMFMKIAGKLQQHDTLSQQPKNEQVDKLKVFKAMLERIMTFLQVPKDNILPSFKDKLGAYEKQIVNILNSIRHRKPEPSMQQPQISQVQSYENLISSQVESMNLQGSVNPSAMSGGQNASQSLMNPLQSNSNIDFGQGNSLSTLPQAAVGSMQPSVSAPQQLNSNLLQHQQLKQQEQLMLDNQLKQKFQQHRMQQGMIHKQQQQHIFQQQKAQVQANQMPQNHQVNDMVMKMRQQLGVNGGGFQQNQLSMYHPQQLKSESQYPNSSPQILQAGEAPGGRGL